MSSLDYKFPRFVEAEPKVRKRGQSHYLQSKFNGESDAKTIWVKN